MCKRNDLSCPIKCYGFWQWRRREDRKDRRFLFGSFVNLSGWIASRNLPKSKVLVCLGKFIDWVTLLIHMSHECKMTLMITTTTSPSCQKFFVVISLTFLDESERSSFHVLKSGRTNSGTILDARVMICNKEQSIHISNNGMVHSTFWST